MVLDYKVNYIIVNNFIY